MPDPARLKALVRSETIAVILALSPDTRATQERFLVDRFPSLPGLDTAGSVLLYASAFAEEFDTAPMMRWVLDQGKRLVCPRVDRKANRLRLREIHSLAEDFQPGTLGIPEPRRSCPTVPPGSVDWVLVPGLAFDARGYRIGRGAGHYDRLLPRLRPGVPRWSLILDEQWIEAVPAEPHDVPLDGIVSPSREVRLTRP